MVRFIADLVNCHVISAGSLLQLLDNFVDAALEDGVPQVSFSKRYSYAVWQYRLWSFQAGGTKLEIFLPKNQHTRRKLLNFENWINGGLRSF